MHLVFHNSKQFQLWGEVEDLKHLLLLIIVIRHDKLQ